MASAKRLLCIHVDGLEVRTALTTISGGKICVELVDKDVLASPLKQKVEESDKFRTVEEATATETDVFNILEKEETYVEEELFQEVAEEEAHEAGAEISNSDIILKLLRRVPAKNYNCAVNLPSTITSVIHLSKDYGQLKKSVRKKRIFAEIAKRLNHVVPDDHLDYVATDDGEFVVFAYLGNIPFLETFDNIQQYYRIKSKFVQVNPDEISLFNLIHYNYQPGPDNNFVIVDFGEDESRIIITRGGQFHHIAPPIQEDIKSPKLLNTVAGKILYERSMGNLADDDQIVLTGRAKQIGAKEFLLERLGLPNIDYLRLDADRFIVPGNHFEKLSDFAVAIGLAVTALLPGQAELLRTNFLPHYVLERQRVYKIAWHGLVLLFLIFLMPFAINYQNTQKKARLVKLQDEVALMDSSIAQLQWAGPLTDSLTYAEDLAIKKLSLMESLSEGTRRWSKTFELIHQAMHEVNNIWFTELTSTNTGVQLSGLSVYRTRIPSFVARFNAAEIRSIIPIDMRGVTLYNFKIDISSLTNDPKAFNPPVPAQTPRQSSMDLRLDPDYTEYLSALQCFDKGAYYRALDKFLKIGESPVYSREANYWIAQCYLALQLPEYAIARLQHQNSPGSFTAPVQPAGYLLLANAYAQAGQQEQAVRTLEELTVHFPNSQEAQFVLGILQELS